MRRKKSKTIEMVFDEHARATLARVAGVEMQVVEQVLRERGFLLYDDWVLVD